MTAATPARDEGLRRRLSTLRRVRVLPPPVPPAGCGMREPAKLSPLTITTTFTTRETNPHG
jgi:hypothetical protein